MKKFKWDNNGFEVLKKYIKRKFGKEFVLHSVRIDAPPEYIRSMELRMYYTGKW